MFVPNPGARCPQMAPSEPRTRRRGTMADLSIKNLGIGLASSLLAGAIAVTSATGVGASARTGASAGWYVYTESNQTSAGGGNAVLAYWVASGGTLTPVGSFATGGDGTGAGLGSQGAITRRRRRARASRGERGLEHGLVLPDPRRRTASARRRGTVRRDRPGERHRARRLGRGPQPGQQHRRLALADVPARSSRRRTRRCRSRHLRQRPSRSASLRRERT